MEPPNSLGTLVNSVLAPVSGFKDLRQVEDNISILIEKNRELIATAAENNSQRTSSREYVLLKNVEMMNNRVEDLVKTFRQDSNFVTKLKLAKHVVKMIEEVDVYLQEARGFGNKSLLPQFSFEKSTLKKNMDAILDSLKDPFIYKIGIWGMGGSGKTTTMKNITTLLSVTNDFDRVIWVTVSKQMNLYQIQRQIAQQVNLDLTTDKYLVTRANRLLEQLKQANKFLIIFDDIWDQISLENLGIPEPNRQNKCKIVLLTRCFEVCEDMETDIIISPSLLSKEDAWEMFVSKAGNEDLSPEVVPLAIQVVEECNGLPLAINVIGDGRRHQSTTRTTWNQLLKSLKSSPTEIQGMEIIFQSLKHSYTRLKSNTARKCFLYLAIFPKDYQIEATELVRYWIADGCIPEEGSLQSKIYQGFRILRELIKACLFDVCSTDHVKWHSVTRWFAIDIWEDNHTLFKAGLGLTESPGTNEWKTPRRISLVKNMIDILPKIPICPNLSVLILRENPLSQYIYPAFFLQMPALKFLDLSYTGISELPTSLSNLHNLQALHLQESTSLEKIPSLAKLGKLQELNLFHTAIKELPPGMEGLISLITLDLSFTCQLEKLVIPKLPLLEEFCMEGSKFWCMDSPTVHKSIKEIACLDKLEMLSLSFVRLDDYLGAFICLQWEMLKNFSIRISQYMDLSDVVYNRCKLNFVYMCNQQIYNHSSTLLLPPNTQEFSITLCDIPRLSELLCLRNMRFLITCHIERCFLLSGGCLILGDEMEEHILTNLEILSLENITGLTLIWMGAVHHPCFTNLRVLEVQWCVSLKTLFCIDLLKHLKNIEVIKVRECKQLEEIVQGPHREEEEDDDPITTATTKMAAKIEEVLCREGNEDDSPNTATSTLMEETVQDPGEEGNEDDRPSRTSSSLVEEESSLRKGRLLFLGKEGSEDDMLSITSTSSLGESEGHEDGNTNITTNRIDIPSLHTLILQGLPELHTISRITWVCASLCHVKVLKCPKLKQLPFRVESLPSLKKIQGEREWWEKLEWGDDSITKSRLQFHFQHTDELC